MILQKASIFLFAACMSVTALYGNDVIFEFAKGKVFGNPSLAPDKQGYVMDKNATGLKVDFSKYAPPATSWPCFNINASELKKTDWSQYGEVVVSLKNLTRDAAARVAITIRQKTWKQKYIISLRVRENSLNNLVIPLDRIAKEVNISQIGTIQFAIDKPSRDFSLEFVSISLSGKPGGIAPDTQISRTYDLRRELLEKKPGVCTIEGTRLEITPEKEVILSFDKHSAGKDRWPGLEVTGRVGGTLNNGDFSTKTHIVGEIEEIGGKNSASMGFSFKDSSRKSFWNGIGSLNGGKVSFDRMILNMGVNLADVVNLRLGTTSPVNAFQLKINKLELVFRPETLYPEARAALEKTKTEPLSPANRKRVDGMIAKLDSIYRKVNGANARYGDIKDFLALVESAKKDASAILRETNFDALKKAMPGFEYGVGLADSMTSVFLKDRGYAMVPAKKAVVQLAANEHESFQVVIAADRKKLNKVKVELQDLTGPGGKKISAKTALIGHAETKRPEYSVEYVGWHPDFLIEYQDTADVLPGESVPFWIRLKADSDAAPGIYKGTVRVSAENAKPYSFPVEAEVFNFKLPVGSPLPSSNNFNLQRMRKAYDIKNESEWQVFRKAVIELAADYKISLDYLYSGPYTSLKGKGSYPDWKSLNDRGLLRSFCILNTTVRDHSINDPNHPMVDDLIERTRKHLAYWSGVAKEFGVWDKAYLYGFDEGRVDAVTSRVFGYVKKNYPDLPVMTTAGIPNADIPGLEFIDIWVPTATTYVKQMDLVKELRKKNKQVWWYVCNFPRPPEPTLMLEVPALVPRLLMGMMSEKYKPEGFLYYSLTIWEQPPVGFGPRTSWNPATFALDNEDGNLFVPGKDRRVLPTIRVENFRDGVEDLWYFTLLRSAVERAKKEKKGDPRLMKAAEAALSVPDSIVRSTGSYTTDPQVVRAKRLELARLIEEFGKL